MLPELEFELPLLAAVEKISNLSVVSERVACLACCLV